jgi:hypothetical protein
VLDPLPTPHICRRIRGCVGAPIGGGGLTGILGSTGGGLFKPVDGVRGDWDLVNA